MDVDGLKTTFGRRKLVNSHPAIVDDFSRAILEDKEPFVPGEEGQKANSIINAVYKSAGAGRKRRTG